MKGPDITLQTPKNLLKSRRNYLKGPYKALLPFKNVLKAPTLRLK